MTFDDALVELARPQAALPREAMQWLDAHWSQNGLDLVTRCEAFLDGEDVPGFDDRVFFFALHLCAAHRATRLYAPLCALLLEGEAADELLGDAVTETVGGMLVSTFDGDLAPLQSIIEAATSDAVAAVTAFLALAYLTRDGRIPAATTEAYLRHVFTTVPREPDYMWAGFAMAVAALGLQALVPLVETLFREGSIARDVMRLADFRLDFDEAQAAVSTGAAFEIFRFAPLEDAVAVLSSWHSFADGPRRRAGTVVNPLKEVGRNDPCPCGSGKKFKKCCLQDA